MRRKEKVLNITEIGKKLERKRKGFLYHRFSKYIVGYEKDGENLLVYSNIGKCRKVKNTRSNVSKLNQVIVKNKVEIAKKIDEYEATSKERLTVLLINIISLIISGGLVPLTFFMGSYIIFLSSVMLFSVLVISSSIIGIDYYVLIQEIQNLKNITGYKKEMEFKLPKVDLKKVKAK